MTENTLAGLDRHIERCKQTIVEGELALDQIKELRGEEFARLRALVDKGEFRNIKSEPAYSPWFTEWEMIIEGDVYKAFEYVEHLSGLDYVRKATAEDITNSVPGPKPS